MAEAGERAGLAVAGFTALAPFLIGCGILDALAATGAPGIGGVHPRGGGACRSCSRRPKWENCSRCWRSRNRTRSRGPASASSIAGTGCRIRRATTNGVAMETPIATGSLVMGALARAARALSAASHRRRHRAARRDEHEIRLSLARVRRLPQSLRERAALARRREGRPRRDRAPEFARCSSRAYWACAKLGAVVVPLSPLLTAPGLASLVADASPRVVIGPSDQRRDAGRSSRRRASGDRARCGRSPTPSPSDEQAGYRALEHADRRRERGRSRHRRRAGRSVDAHVHVRHHGHAERHPAHALHPRDVRGAGELVADDAGVGRAALGLDRVQRRDDDDAAGVHARRDVRRRARLRRRKPSSRRSSASASRTRCSCRRRSSRS